MSTMTEGPTGGDPIVDDPASDADPGGPSGPADEAVAAELVRLHSVAHAELLDVLGRLDAHASPPAAARAATPAAATAVGAAADQGEEVAASDERTSGATTAEADTAEADTAGAEADTAEAGGAGAAGAGADGAGAGLGGFGDVAVWVQTRFKVCQATAREWVRVARALRGLPCIAALYRQGEVCWDQVRHATRFATPDTDELVADELPGWSGDQLAQLAREHNASTKDADAETDRLMRLRTRRDHRRGGTHFSLFLPDGDAEPLRTTLERRATQIGPDPVTGIWDPLERRMAQAAAMLGAAGLAADSDLDRAMAVIHIDADLLSGEHPGNGTTDTGGSVSAEVARRLACDGWIQYIAEDGDDQPIGVGRRQRTVPRWLRRLVRRRDGRCRCCGGPIHHIHHIRHWTWLGPTDLENLVGLCWTCHHRVHEGGWGITGHPDAVLTFTNPQGQSVSSLPQPVARTTRRRARTRPRPHGGPTGATTAASRAADTAASAHGTTTATTAARAADWAAAADGTTEADTTAARAATGNARPPTGTSPAGARGAQPRSATKQPAGPPPAGPTDLRPSGVPSEGRTTPTALTPEAPEATGSSRPPEPAPGRQPTRRPAAGEPARPPRPQASNPSGRRAHARPPPEP